MLLTVVNCSLSLLTPLLLLLLPCHSLNTVIMVDPKKSPYFSTPLDPSIIILPNAFPPESYFSKEILHPALIIPAKQTAILRQTLKDILMHRPKIKSVYPVDDSDPIDENDRSFYRKLVLTADERINVFENEVVKQLLNEGCQKSQFQLTFTYNDWTVDEVLRELLPVKEIPSAFEIVGHIAHVNLKEDLLPFQHIVGKVIIDKNKPRIETVVNKIGTIETEYRTFGMKVISGNDKQGWNVVHLKEEGCTFTLDFQNVYWNSRLAGEHHRLVQYIKNAPGTVIADVMAGVGPFAVPLTCQNQQRRTVYANDLNPTSYHYLGINAKKNKCQGLHSYNMDGRAFLHQLDADEHVATIDHVLMNLPASAPEFLDAFRGWSRSTLLQIHVHCFASKLDTANQEAIDRCCRALGCDIDNANVHMVRDISPKKNMYCVSFVLPEAARLLKRIQIEQRPEDEGIAEPDAKKARMLL